jgi:hypothetical protein
LKNFFGNLIHANNNIYAWAIIISLYIASVEFVLWHIPVWKKMSHDDKRVRGGMLILMLNVATATLFTVLGEDSIWRRFANAVAGVLIMIGMAGLLWDFRAQRKTAALQPHIGDPTHSRPVSDTLGDNSSDQGDQNGIQKL